MTQALNKNTQEHSTELKPTIFYKRMNVLNPVKDLLVIIKIYDRMKIE